MSKLINKLRENRKVYSIIRYIYGQTFGMWPLKDAYLKYAGAFNGKKRTYLLGKEKGQNEIKNAIRSGEIFMAARFGSTEFRNMIYDNEFELLCFYSGFFPKNKRLLKKFREVYMNSAKKIDYLIAWNYRNHFLKKLKLLKSLPNVKKLIISHITDGVNNHWTEGLEGKKVLVVHPFKKTIEKQHQKREKLGIMPPLEKLEVVKAVQTLADNEDSRFESWFEALEYMKKEIDKKDFDIALIGCGAYGMPLAAHVKSKGKQALHLGGGLQLLFGIKGKRWEGKIETNENWTKPLKEDFMQNYDKIEGGCYW